jgi:hypothetical protein
MDYKELADCLRYLTPAKKMMCERYNFTRSHMELLIFIYSRREFQLKRLYEYAALTHWESKLFSDLKAQKFIKIVRPHKTSLGTVYGCTKKTDKIVEELFAIITGQAPFSDDPKVNPMFKKETYTQRYHSKYMLRANQEREQRPAPGLYDTEDDEF